MTEQTPQFNVTGHEQYWKEIIQENKDSPLSLWGLAFGISWANNMEKLMKGNPLTVEIVNKALRKANPTVDEAMGIEVLCLLCKTWVHGDQLIPFAPDFSHSGVDPDVMRVARALSSDEAKDFIRNYPDAGKLDTSTIDGRNKEAGRILATVLKNKKTIDAFEKAATKSKTSLNAFVQNFIPILKIEEPDEPDQELLDYAPDLKKTWENAWKDGVGMVCREARKVVTKPPFCVKLKQAEQ